MRQLWPGLPCSLLLMVLPASAQLRLERVELTAQLDPELRAVYAKARLLLRNHTATEVRLLQLTFPPPLGARTEPTVVWDREGQLAWHADPPESEHEPRVVRVALRSWLRPGKKADIVISYEIALEEFSASNTPLFLSATEARVATTGWYPQLWSREAAGGPGQPQLPDALRLAVRLPKEWGVESSANLKKIRNGTVLASYELKLEPVPAKAWLLTAQAPAER